jgi:hypothetical protein
VPHKGQALSKTVYAKQEQLKQIDPSADRDKVVKRINSLRTNLRKEKSSRISALRGGCGTNL